MEQHAYIIRQCTHMLVKIRNKRLLKDYVRTRQTPSVGEIENVRNLPHGHDVFVYRKDRGWAQYTLVIVRGNEADVNTTKRKTSTFPINLVRLTKKI